MIEIFLRVISLSNLAETFYIYIYIGIKKVEDIIPFEQFFNINFNWKREIRNAALFQKFLNLYIHVNVDIQLSS